MSVSHLQLDAFEQRSAGDEVKHISAAAFSALVTGDNMFSEDFYDVGLGAALKFARLGAYHDICAALGAISAAGHISIIIMAYRGVDVFDIDYIAERGFIHADCASYPYGRNDDLQIFNPRTRKMICGYIRASSDEVALQKAKKTISFSLHFLRGAIIHGRADIVAHYMIWQCGSQYDEVRGIAFNRGIEHVSDITLSEAVAIAAATGGDCKNIFSYVANMQWTDMSRHRHIGPKTAAAFAEWITSQPTTDIEFYKISILDMWAGRGNVYYKKIRGAATGPGTFLGALANAIAAIDTRYSVVFEFECRNCWTYFTKDCECDEDGRPELYGVCEECSVYGEMCKCDQCCECCECGESCKCDE